MKLQRIVYFLLVFSLAAIFTIGNNGCAQIGAISGGTKDTIAPVLVSATPKLLTTNFTGNRITFTFDEYIDELQEVQKNVLVSPYPKQNPEFRTKLKTLSVKLKDTLLPNTTYSINFGDAIKDVNEGNVLKNFTYVFSTGNNIDSLTLSGRVLLAETGKTDSTIQVYLYRNAVDSTVKNFKPVYIAFVKGDGSFNFRNLPADNFRIYALKDGDGGKTYNSKTELFAFLNDPVTVGDTSKHVELFAYAEEKPNPPYTATVKSKAPLKKLRYTIAVAGQKQSLIDSLEITFNNPIKTFDASKIILTDTNFNRINGVTFSVDSNKVFLKTNWTENSDYRLIVNRDAVRDSADSTIAKTDTVRFKTRAEFEYGNVVLRFNNLNLDKHPVLQLVQQDVIKRSIPLTSKEWRDKLFPPGEYEMRILYDDNNNGRWDPGNYDKKKQPEKVVSIPKKLTVKENWDNESDINL